jgi:hypothetical protein
METTSRRTLLRSLLGIPATLALGNLGCNRDQKPGGDTGELNLYLKGPFSLVFYQGLTKIHVISPAPACHHDPSMSSDAAETVLSEPYDYQLLGVSAQPTTWKYPDQRLTVPAAAIGLDKGGVIDKNRTRYFSLEVPSPHDIVPLHPVKMTIGGKNAPAQNPPVVPVGYVFVYRKTDLSQVKVSCQVSGKTVFWDPQLSALPGDSSAEIIVEMTSKLDSDPCHSVAIDSFGKQRDLYQGLDLSVSYPGDPPCPGGDSNPCPPQTESPTVRGPFVSPTLMTHTGADCKAGIIEITDVSNNATLG